MLTVSANIGGVAAEIGNIYIDETKLTLDTDYTIDDDEITLIKDKKLSDLTEGEYTIKIETDINDLFIELEVVNTEE